MSVYITREMLWQAANEPRQEGIQHILRRATDALRRKLRQRRTMAELGALNDWELRDIGLNRGDIPRVVAGLDDVDLGLAVPAPAPVRVAA